MTRLYEDATTLAHPSRPGFRNFTWTNDAIREWDVIWGRLWHLGIKWEWQNADRYARKRGEIYNLFAVHNDAVRLDMAVPLPSLDALREMDNWLLGAHVNNARATETQSLLRGWMKKYV